MATENTDFDRLFEKVKGAIGKTDADYPWVNCPTPPITEPVKERVSEIPKVVPVRDFEIYFPAPSPVLSAIADLHKALSV